MTPRVGDDTLSSAEMLRKAILRYNRYIGKKIIQSPDKYKFFKYIHTRSGCRTSIIPTLFDENGHSYTTPPQKANLLASQFQKHFSSPVSPDTQSQIPSSKLQPQVGPGLWFHKEEILEILTKWPTFFSVSPDLVPLPFVKKSPDT